MARTAIDRAVGGLLLLAVALGPLPVAAQEVSPPSIVIVDVTQILRESKGARDIQAQIDKQTEAYTKDVSAQENELHRMQDELERQRTVLAPEAFNTKTREYQQRFEALDRGVQMKRQTLQQTYSEAMTKVEATALQIIADIAGERRANLVLSKAAVLFEAPGLDITSEVIRRLDQKLPAVPLALAEQPAAIAPPPSAKQ
jgi:outer membrane protein